MIWTGSLINACNSGFGENILTVMKMILVPIAAMALLLAGCAEDRETRIRRETDEAVEATKRAGKETGEAAKAVGDKIVDKTKEGIGKAAEATEKGAKKVKDKVKD